LIEIFRNSFLIFIGFSNLKLKTTENIKIMVFIVYKKGNTNQFIIEMPSKTKIEEVLKRLINCILIAF
jgi:hypothetical protein